MQEVGALHLDLQFSVTFRCVNYLTFNTVPALCSGSLYVEEPSLGQNVSSGQDVLVTLFTRVVFVLLFALV